MKGKIFTAQQVQAMLNKSKVMFREVIKPQPDFSFYDTAYADCPYQVGQKIFCKEKFSVIKNIDFNYPPHDWRRDGRYIYEADAARSVGMYGCVKWKPAQHMKQEHSRLILLIKEIRVERLAEISEEDAKKEGFKNTFVGFQHPVYNPGRTANQDFEIFWNATHKKPEEKFEANPWVWCVTMEVVK